MRRRYLAHRPIEGTGWPITLVGSGNHLTETVMTQIASFVQLQDLVQEVSNEETVLALDIARRRSACISLDAYPPHLVTIISQVPDEAMSWFAALLSLRALQIESSVGQKRSEAFSFSASPHWALD